MKYIYKKGTRYTKDHWLIIRYNQKLKWWDKHITLKQIRDTLISMILKTTYKQIMISRIGRI